MSGRLRIGMCRTGTCSLFVALAALFVGLLGDGAPPLWREARAGPEKEEERRGGLTLKEYKSRLSKLRTAASRWIVARVEFPSRCPLCKGSGKTRVRTRRGFLVRECNQCEGNHAWISTKHYKKVYYDMRTPAFKALPGIQDTLNAQYKLAQAGKPWPTMIKRHRMREREMVDDTHGTVKFLFNASKVPTVTRWIWTEMPRRKGSKKVRYDWYSYDSRSDGPWPDAARNSPDAPVTGAGRDWPTDRGTWAGLETAESFDVRRAVGRARITFRAFDSFKQGRAVRIRLKPWTDKRQRPLAERAGEDAVNLCRAVLETSKRFDRVETEWHATWRDPYGQLRVRPTWIAALTREAHAKILWSTASSEGHIGSLDWRDVEYPGWQPVEDLQVVPQDEPAEEAPNPPEPTPSKPPEGEDPQPSEDEPPEPEPAPEPDRPVPPRPTPRPPPPPPEPESWELPELTSAARKKGEQGIAHMKALFKDAVTAHDEGVVARREGAHDIWQEKLSEARTYLGDLEEVWLEEVVAAMPGRDEGEQDAVANEHFGGIWDEVDKLKSMVRKMSAMR